MKTTIYFICIFIFIFCFHLFAALAEPVPDIKANGSDGPVTVSPVEMLSVTIELQALDWLGVNSDWWCVAQTPLAPPGNWYHYNAAKNVWRQGFSVSFQGALTDVSPPFEVLNTSGLPTGSYVFYFGVDNSMNAVWDGEQYYDSVEVYSANPFVPSNLFNIGNSIGEGVAAHDDIGAIHHETVWSTGYNPNDSVYTLNERFEDENPTDFYENNTARDDIFNHAVEGDEMEDFVAQANEVLVSAGVTPSGEAGMITIFLGNNDVCTDEVGTMTDPAQFEAQYRAGLDVLVASDETKDAYIHVSGIPDIYWLWIAKRSSFWCRVLVWPLVPCRELLENPGNDCGSGESELDPDNIHPDDGENCIRRKNFHAAIRDDYNRILRDVLEEYRDNGLLPNAYYIDIFDIQFDASQVNNGDCFHPSDEGHQTLAQEHWCRSLWGQDDPTCEP
jgi:lysophospholipase L1-like esterase